MKQVTITTGKATIVVVDLPYDAFNVKVDKGYIIYNNSKFSNIISSAYLSQKNGSEWKHVGHPSQLTEEDWKGIVDRSDRHPDDKLYIDYTEESTRYVYLLTTATESGLSLLRANGVVLENNIPPFKERLQDWQQAQEQVWTNSHMFIKID